MVIFLNKSFLWSYNNISIYCYRSIYRYIYWESIYIDFFMRLYNFRHINKSNLLVFWPKIIFGYFFKALVSVLIYLKINWLYRLNFMIMMKQEGKNYDLLLLLCRWIWVDVFKKNLFNLLKYYNSIFWFLNYNNYLYMYTRFVLICVRVLSLAFVFTVLFYLGTCVIFLI